MDTKVEQNQLQTIDDSPASLLALAVQNNASIEHLERLMALKERWDAIQAKKHFLESLSHFQNDVPAITKGKQVGYTAKNGAFVGYKYAELGDIDEAIKAAMSKSGLSKRWEISEDGEKIICTCIISHIDGHEEKTTMSSIKDASGNKNEIQSRASAVTYLQRYTLIGALGLTTASEDNDGDGTPAAKPTSQNNNPDLPWLNIRDKQGKLLPDGDAVIKNIAAGIETIETLSDRYKLSKAVKDELIQVKVTGNKDEYIDHEPVISPAPAITEPDKKPFVIPGLWYATVEKWKSVTDAIDKYTSKATTINAHKELQTFFFDEALKQCTTKAEVLSLYNAAKEAVMSSSDLQNKFKATQNKFSQPVKA